MEFIETDLIYFWSRVVKSDHDCWIWTHPRNNKGYGYPTFRGTRMLAHRASWIIHKGPIPPGLDVLHHCDNPACVRPDHLFLGTHSDNMRDAAKKGRNYSQIHPESRRGMSNGCAKLDIESVHAIRAAQGMTLKQLAIQYGVSIANISYIRRHETWRDI